MQKIPVDKAAEGMVLAKPVAKENGVVLMGEGTELSDRIIERLLDIDIKTIVVKGHPLDTGKAEETLEQLFEKLDDRFSTIASDKLCSQIKEIIKEDIKIRKEESEL